MTLPDLREFTNARVALGRTGNSLPLKETMRLALAHAQAREAVHSILDVPSLASDVGGSIMVVRSQAKDRAAYLRRPDLGRSLNQDSRHALLSRGSKCETVFVIADGLSALAVHRHAAPFLRELDRTESIAVVAEQARVAIGDEIGDCLGAKLAVVLIGERPGLSCSDSLGIYLTWNPRPGLTDSNRNCISNIHEQGLTYRAAAHTLACLMNEARRLKLSGVLLKDNSHALPSPAESVSTDAGR